MYIVALYAIAIATAPNGASIKRTFSINFLLDRFWIRVAGYIELTRLSMLTLVVAAIHTLQFFLELIRPEPDVRGQRSGPHK